MSVTAAVAPPDELAERGRPDVANRWPTLGYGPLDGRVRALFFALVLVVGARWFLVTVPHTVRAVPPELYDGAGLFGLLVDDRDTALVIVEVLRGPLIVALVLSMIGLGGRWPMLVAGGAGFLLVGASLSGIGSGHAWYLAVAAMVVLGLTHRPSSWSVDAVLTQRWPAWPFGRAGGDRSATGRAIVLVLAVATLAAGGCAKLLEAGWRWMDGTSLRTYLLEHGDPKGPLGRWLTEVVVDHGWVAAVLAVATIVVELGAVVTLLRPRTRLVYFVVLAGGFHAVTWLLMLPDFAPQAIVYVLLVGWLFRPTRPGGAVRPHVVAGGLAVMAFAVVVGGRVEWYPLTSIPMYRSYVDEAEISGLPRSTFDDVNQLCARADDLTGWHRPWYAQFDLADRLALQLDGGPPRAIESVAAPTRQGARFWADELALAVLDDLPCTDGAPSGAPVAATELGALRRELGDVERVELILVGAGGPSSSLGGAP